MSESKLLGLTGFAAVALALFVACDLPPGSIGNETDGATDSKGDDPGQDGPSCGGIAGLQCNSGEACIFAAGTCDVADNLGTCQATPDVCIEIYAPVCGCDGQTYANDCFAQAAGASIDYEGECGGASTSGGDPTSASDTGTATAGDTTGDDAGTSTTGDTAGDTGSGAACDGFPGLACPNDDEYCHHEPGVCQTVGDAQGECRVRPEVCTQDLDPVCGCDGNEYNNECEAHRVGVSVAQHGSCDGPSPTQLCQDSGGTWDPLSCGHYVCGQPPLCAAVIPGCDCGTGRTFVPGEGCADDPSC